MKNESKLYVIELTNDERVWLSELVDSRAHDLNNLLIGVIGDDREAWLTEVNIADRVGEEDCLSVRPTENCLVESRDSEHAAALAESQKRVAELEDAMKWILSHGWRTVHIGRELQKLSLIASREQVKWLHTALEGK